MGAWWEVWSPYIWGYLFSLLGGHFAVQAIIRPLYGANHGARLPTLVAGLIERVLYTSSILVDSPSLIGLWLGLKVIGSWKHLEGPDRTAARDHINIFLSGNAVSLMYGFVGGQSVLWLQVQGWGGHVPTIPLALTAGTVVLAVWLMTRVRIG